MSEDSKAPRTPTHSKFSWNDLTGKLFDSIVDFFISIIDLIMVPIQRVLGVTGMAFIFLMPNMLIFGIFVITPMFMNVYYSTTGGTELFLQNREFVGMENFQILFDCDNYLEPNSCDEDIFWRAVHNTTIFVTLQVGVMVLISMVTALALNSNIKGRGFFRSVFFYPVLLSPVVVALIWKWILQREGLLNALITAAGGERILFLLDPTWATGWVIFVSTWAQMGFHTLILLAGLQAIPAELYEAGEIDGAGRWHSFLFITIPLWTQTLFVVLVLSLIRAVQVFDQVFVLTGGGPGTATQYMVQYIYNTAFTNQIPRRGLAAAASLIMGGVLLVLTMIQLRLGRETDAA